MNGETNVPGPDNEGDMPDLRPAAIRLHPDRPKVTRLSRKALIGLSGLAAAGVAATLFFALRPHVKLPTQNLLGSTSHNLPEGLLKLPQLHFADAPKLGPPLPGDLGKPMLNAGVTPSASPITGAQSPEQQRLTQEHDAARTSHLFATTNPQQLNAGSTVATAQASPALGVVPGSADPVAAENMQDNKLAFASGGFETHMMSPAHVQRPASPFVIQTGWLINAALAQGLKSDLPGDIRAQVTEDVYDSPTGHYLLIPQGSTLQGRYSSQVSFGQKRIQMIWTRLTFPNGSWMDLGHLPGSDTEGYSGVEDEVDEHWGALFKAAILSTLLSVGAEAGASDSENNLAQAIRQGASQSINQTGQQIVSRNLNIQPTLTARFGLPVTVSVDQDLVLEPYPDRAAR